MKEAATALGASQRSVKRARVVLERGIPGLVAAVERGVIKLGRATTIAGLQAEQQVACLVAPKPKSRAARDVKPEDDRHRSPGAIDPADIEDLYQRGLAVGINLADPKRREAVNSVIRENVFGGLIEHRERLVVADRIASITHRGEE